MSLTEFGRKWRNFGVSEARRLLKLKLIEYKGGKCQECGYNTCSAALDFRSFRSI